MNHTAEPWQQRDDQTSEGWITIIGNVDGEYIDGKPNCTYDVIARCEDEFGERLPNVSANAARIVSCVNALAGLHPEGVRDVVEALEELVDVAPGHNHWCGAGAIYNCTCDMKPAKDKARAALAKVRAQS